MHALPQRGTNPPVLGVDDERLGTSRLLSAVQPSDREHLRPHLTTRLLKRGQILFEPGEEVDVTYFPCRGTMASLLVVSSDGREVEAATIGYEGAIGGIVSAGHKPAYARAMVQIGGPAFAIDTAKLEEAKHRSPMLRDLL